MITDRFFGKKRAKRESASAPSATAPAQADADPSLDLTLGSEPVSSPLAVPGPAGLGEASPRAGASAPTHRAPHPQDTRQKLQEGLPLEDYARTSDLTETEVWRRLRRGELVGRTQRGRLTIYSSPAAAAAADDDLSDLHERLAEPEQPHHHFQGHPPSSPRAQESERPLPPLPDTVSDGRIGATSHHGAAGGFLALTGNHAHSPEFALLLDHLSLAKEENREILRMTQESIRKVTELTESIVEMKDAVIEAKQSVIEAKETQISSLQTQLDDRERLVKRLLQQTEDLEMLAKTMAADH